MFRVTTNFLLFGLVCTAAQARSDRWLGGGDSPWGKRTAEHSHPRRDLPDTGVTRSYDFSISRASFSPDGVEQSLIVANGQFPGPVIEANWGDWIEVTVSNNIEGPEEPTAVHWHGLNQPGTPWFDGVPTVGQCPIAPGASLTYKFRADEYGTSWWHSHQSAQYTQGLFGAIVVHGPSEYSDYDEDLGPVIVNDWYHAYYTDIESQLNVPPAGGIPVRPMSQSNLVGGAGRFVPNSGANTGANTGPNAAPNSTPNAAPSGAPNGPPNAAPAGNATVVPRATAVPYKSWKVEAGKSYRIRLINAGSVGFETISIDDHKLKVIANDFIPVQPYEVDYVTLAVGQRTDVVFTASGSAGESYWLRAWNDPLCGQTEGSDGRGIIAYEGSDPAVEPTSTATAIPPNTSCATDDLSLTVPVFASEAKEPDATITIKIEQRPDANGIFQWFMNGVSYSGDPANPLISTAITQDTTAFPASSSVYDLGSNKTVRIILENTSQAPHPMHIHGHDFQVLATGAGTWDGTIVRPENPQRRDTEMMWGGTAVPSYTVIQYEQNNPGIWPLHCHIAWHLSQGMVTLMLELPDELVHMDKELPASIGETCETFAVWQEANPDHAGGGLRRSRR